jgi:DNA invertase Pin-like site-specific DNA recombinase
MSKRRYQPNSDNSKPYFPDGTAKLPTSRPIAVYYRQSTLAQVGNISTSMQTVDMVEILTQKGWAEKDIILIDMDEGISGSTKIDERPGMSRLFDLITSGTIGAVACQDEDRLFRDVTQIQVNIFIEACRAANVQVITPFMIYDFANPQGGEFHKRQFRFKSEMAAEYVNAIIRGKLHRAKERKIMEGRWGGAGMPVGYMVDDRRKLPDGRANPDWHRFTPYEPYVTVVNQYFDLFLRCGGNLHETVRQIIAHGPYYPDPVQTQPPEGFRIVYRFRKIMGLGFLPTRTGLRDMFTNANYLGHWMLRGQVIIWNNHPAIVPEDKFMQAFNYLSPTTFDGKPNRDYRPIQDNARPSLDENRPSDRPLYAGFIVSEWDGELRKVGTAWVRPLEHYTYAHMEASPTGKYIWSKAAKFVDAEITKMLLYKMQATFNPAEWEKTVMSASERFRETSTRTAAQIRHLEKVMENQIASLETLSNPILIRQIEERYEAAQEEHARLKEELSSQGREKRELAALGKLRDTCGPALENWDNLTRNEKREVAAVFIDRVEATPVEEHGLQLVVYWRDATSSEIVLPRQASTGVQWLPSEVARLLEMHDERATQVDIAAAFPHRTWDMIRNKLYSLIGAEGYHFEVTPIRGHETYPMFLERTDGNREPYQAGSGDPWKMPALEKLSEMLDREATKLELLEAFPYRTWGRIRAKVTELRGRDFKIPGPKPMHRDETFVQYQARISGTEEP